MNLMKIRDLASNGGKMFPSMHYIERRWKNVYLETKGYARDMFAKLYDSMAIVR